MSLPTAPRAARGPDVDMSRVPTDPPFTAFMGNLPFDVEEIEIERFFHGLKVTKLTPCFPFTWDVNLQTLYSPIKNDFTVQASD